MFGSCEFSGQRSGMETTSSYESNILSASGFQFKVIVGYSCLPVVADGGPIDHSYINDIYTLFYSLNNSMIPSGLFLNNTMISSGLFFGLTIIDE